MGKITMAAEHDFNWPFGNEEADAATVATMDILKALVLQNQFGRICARAGWTIEMVFHDGDSLAVRERSWKVVDLFCEAVDRKSTRLNSSHSQISYAVFCLKKKKKT